jgi:hypothetical protein
MITLRLRKIHYRDAEALNTRKHKGGSTDNLNMDSRIFSKKLGLLAVIK